MFRLARAGRSFVTGAAPEGLIPAAKSLHPSWPWALGLSGSTLVTGFLMMRQALHSAERDLDALRKDSNELVKSNIKQGLQFEQISIKLDQITVTLAEISKKLVDARK